MSERLKIAKQITPIIQKVDERISQVVLFGAETDGETQFSDVDVCIVAKGEGTTDFFPLSLIPKVKTALKSNGYILGIGPGEIHLFTLQESYLSGQKDESLLDPIIQQTHQNIRRGTKLIK